MKKTTIKESRKKRQVFSESFKADAVRMVASSGKTKESVARMLGVSVSALSRWVSAAKEGKQGEAISIALNESERIRQLEAENHQLRLEREILKKATMFFAKHQT
jgi:transposase